jgi:hypothetical protein
MRQPRRSGVGASRVSRQGKCLACCLQSSNVLAGLPPHPRSAWPQQAFPDPGFQDGSGTPDDFHQHQPEQPHGRPHASHSERALGGPRIRFSYQGGLRLASNAPGCASSPLHPCDVTVTSPDCGSSPVRPSRAAPGQDFEYLLSYRQARRTFPSGGHVSTSPSPAWPGVVRAMESKGALQPPALRCGSSNAVTRYGHIAAPAPLRARGCRGLTLLAGKVGRHPAWTS